MDQRKNKIGKLMLEVDQKDAQLFNDKKYAKYFGYCHYYSLLENCIKFL